MKNKNDQCIYRSDGTEICRECGHAWVEFGDSHYPECRYYVLSSNDEDFETEEYSLIFSSVKQEPSWKSAA